MKGMHTIITLGVVVAIVPFLGFPTSWKNIMFALLGLAIAGLSYRLLQGRTNNTVESESESLEKPDTSSEDLTESHE